MCRRVALREYMLALRNGFPYHASMGETPNVVFFLVDDLGWRDLSCYGSEFYETPNIDKLCADGLKFTDAYAACPVCSPTRASILAGKYPATVGVTNFIDWGCRSHPNRGKLVDVSYFRELPLTEKSLARTLKEHGYDTWHVGKWHLGGPGAYPERHGFDVNYGGCEFGMPTNGYFSPFGFPGLQEPAQDGTYLTDYLTDKAVALIENRERSETPFFLNMWFYTVHTPIQAKEEDIRYFEDKAMRLGLDVKNPFEEGGFQPGEHRKHMRIVRRKFQSDPVFAAMVRCLDDSVGRILDAVGRTGESGNTLVIFTSDNGGESSTAGSPTCNAPLSEGKGWMYEGGTREPLIVKWPGVVDPGTETTQPVTSPDFYPTILEAASLPPVLEQHTDGFSFLPLLRGESWSRPRPIFAHFPHYGNQGGTPGAYIRDGDFKLIEFFEDSHVELYNLRQDIGEEVNLAAGLPDKTKAMRETLHSWQTEIEAAMPVPNSDYHPWTDREPSGHFPDTLGPTYPPGTGPEV
jgi:arylsulfatase A-like enzyme